MIELEGYYRENFDNLVKRVSKRCGNQNDAEDVVQTAFERAIKYQKACHGSLDKWFSGILNNCIKDYQKMIRLGPVTKPLEEHLTDLEPIIPDDVKPFLKKEIKAMIAEEASSEDRSILKLHLDFGFNQKEISSLLVDVSILRVKCVISNFRRKVIKRYK